MRQTVRTLLFAGMLFSATGAAVAEPVVAGHHLAEARSGATPVFLAHVFNADGLALKAGSYEVGLELSGGQGRKVYSLKPTSDIEAGRVSTFRMPLSTVSPSADGNFRVFVRANRQTTFSEPYSLSNHRLGGAIHGKETALYTEAPPEMGDPGRMPTEVPFENELVRFDAKAEKAATVKPRKGSAAPVKTVVGKGTVTGKTTTTLAATTLSATTSAVSSIPVTPKKPARPAQSKEAPATVEKSAKTSGSLPTPAAEVAVKPRTIDASEFKTIRTIDEELVIYVIRTGDTLKSIAERYYGTAAKEKTIAEFNFIDDPKAVKVGEEIIVEVKALKASGSKNSVHAPVAAPAAQAQTAHKSEVAPAAPATTETVTTTCPGGTYVIQPGDNLGKIAKNTLGKATLASKLLQANPGLNPKNLKVGTTILIPEISGKQG